MNDNVTANPGALGAVFRTFADGTAEWPASVVAYVTGGSAGVWTLQQVDASHGLPVNLLNASVAVTAISLPLPSGAATESTLSSLNSKVTACDTGAVVVASSALPSGASTAANQSTIIAGLASIDSHVDGVETLLASIDSHIVACNTGAVVLSSGTLTGITNVVHVDDNSSSLTIDGTLTGITNVVHVDDNSGSLTIDGTLTGITNVVHIDDNSGSLTVDGTIAATQSGTWTVGISAAQTIAVTNVGTFAVQAAQSGTWTVGISAAQTIAVTNAGTFAVQATQSGTWNIATLTGITNVVHVDDNSGSITVDGTVAATQSGTWNVATVASITNVVHIDDNSSSITVDGTVSIGAGTALIGQVAASNETSTVYNGTTALTPKFASISCAASGDNTLVAAVTSKKIRVLAISIINSGTAVNVYFREDTGGTAIFGDATNKIPLDKTGAAGPSGLVLGSNPQGWMQSAVGKPLVLNLSTAQGVCGGLVYVEV